MKICDIPLAPLSEEGSKKLFLKPGNNQLVAVENDPKNTSPKMHEVQPKEGLYAISKKYGITVLQIKEWNNLSDDNLKIGQQLIISK